MSHLEEVNNRRRIEAYNSVSSKDTFLSRASRATSAVVEEVGDQLIAKRDIEGGVPLAAREYAILTYLQETGVVPKIDDEYGLSGYPLTFQMEKINNGATIEDWLHSYGTSTVSKGIMKEVLIQMAIGIQKVWQQGVIHGDLHLNNVVVGMKKGGEIMKPTIIDFGISAIDPETLHQVAQDLGVEFEVSESQYYFQRQVRKRYETKDEELEFVTEEIDDFIRCPDISKMLRDVRDELGKYV